MLVALKSLITRLDSPVAETNRTARLLNWFSIAIILIAAGYGFLFSILIGRFDVIIFTFCAIVLSVGINVAARRGYVRSAAFIFLMGIWIIVTLPNFAPTADGIYDAAYAAYVVPILLAGFLLGSMYSIFFAMVSVIFGLALLLRSLAIPITFIETQPSSQVLHFGAQSLFFFLTALLFTLTNRSLTAALKRAQSSEENLLVRNRELEQEIADRQQIELALRASDQTAKEFQDRLKDLHEISIQLANIETLDELHRQAIILGHEKLGFDRIGWFVCIEGTEIIQGTYGIDPEGNLDDVYDLKTTVSLDNWKNNFQRFTSNGHVYYRIDTVLSDRSSIVGKGWNVFAAVSHGGEILGWIVADNLFRQQPLQDFQLEIMRLYGVMLGQLFVQKQTQQMLAEKDKRLQLALNAAYMRSWDWNIETGDILRNDFYEAVAVSIKTHYVDFMNHIHPDDQQTVLNAVRKMVEYTGTFEAEYRFLDKGGGIHWFYSLGQPYLNESGELAGVAGVIQDITGRKAIEESLKRADQQGMELILEKERVGALTEFISTISHDFKTPLAIINNSLYLLQRIDDPAKQKDKLNLIKEQTLLLDKQIQDILTISRLDYAPQVITHPVNINLLLSKIADFFHPSFENKKQSFHLDLQPALPNILADSDELDRALVNLVENAINYTPLNGRITVATRVIGNQIECVISDTGIGMIAQDTQRIFDNFYRAENARMINSKGTGLGLAIVKRIVTNHNGTIQVESELGKGTTFRLRFPVMVVVQ